MTALTIDALISPVMQFSAKEYKEALEVLETDYSESNSKAMDVTDQYRDDDNKVLDSTGFNPTYLI